MCIGVGNVYKIEHVYMLLSLGVGKFWCSNGCFLFLYFTFVLCAIWSFCLFLYIFIYTHEFILTLFAPIVPSERLLYRDLSLLVNRINIVYKKKMTT